MGPGVLAGKWNVLTFLGIRFYAVPDLCLILTIAPLTELILDKKIGF